MDGDPPSLCAAVSSGDSELVNGILASSPPEALDVPDNRGFSPLMCACSLEGTAHLVRVLIRKGANINFAAADSGLTPLLAAAKAGNSKATHYLLEKGANTAARDSFGRTCLHWACVSGSDSCLRQLLRATGSTLVNAQDLSGYTALMTATEYGREDMVRSLLQAGADKAIQNKVTHVAYDLADWYGHRRIADVLSKWGEADPKDATGASDSTAMSDGFAASSPPLPLQMALYFNIIVSIIFFLFVTSVHIHKRYNFQYDRYMRILVPVFIAGYSVCEPLRLYLGYSGNLKEKIPNLSAFVLLTFFPVAPLVAYLSFAQIQKLPIEIAVGIPYMALLAVECVSAFTTVRALIHKQTALFYSLCQQEKQ